MNANLRVGIGYDIHRLVEGRPLRLGGIDIEFDRGLIGGACANRVFAGGATGFGWFGLEE